MKDYTFHLQALSDIWMGGPKRSTEIKDTRLNEKSLLGALRWWTEAIIRAAGGFACDPTDDKMRCEAKHHCLACDIFGCEGLSKRFALSIRESTQSNAAQTEKPFEFRHRPCKKDNSFIVSFDFFHPQFQETQKALLLNSALIMFSYGSIGGKIGQKPPSQTSANKKETWHKDYGLLCVEDLCPIPKLGLAELRQLCNNFIPSLKQNLVLPNFDYFFFYFFDEPYEPDDHPLGYDKINKDFLALIHQASFNSRKVYKHDPSPQVPDWKKDLRGNDYGENDPKKRKSKRLFVFSDRIWGWTEKGEYLAEIEKQIAISLKDASGVFMTGLEVLQTELGV